MFDIEFLEMRSDYFKARAKAVSKDGMDIAVLVESNDLGMGTPFDDYDKGDVFTECHYVRIDGQFLSLDKLMDIAQEEVIDEYQKEFPNVNEDAGGER